MARLAGAWLGTCAIVLASAAARAADAGAKVFELDINGAAVPAARRVMRVTKGDAVRLRVTSDTPGSLHLHAYRLESNVAPGRTAEIAFAAFATGRFRLEWHAAAPWADTGGTHHAAPLATLEVMPK